MTTAVRDVTIPGNACVGPQTVQLATGGELVTSSFSVYAHTPSLVLSPSSSKAGTSVKVNLIGEFSHFVPNSTLAVIDGARVQIQNFSITTPTSTTAPFVIHATPPAR